MSFTVSEMPPIDRPTSSLLQSSLFSDSRVHLSPSQQAERSYERAKVIANAYACTPDDIQNVSAKFVDMYSDPLCLKDGAATTILFIQYNLAIGSILQYSSGRSDLGNTITELLKFEKIGLFMLSEVNHGLDALNIETTATMLATGEFELHTPHSGAAKIMAPTIPVFDTPCVAIVYAKVFSKSQNHGIRLFLVPLNNGKCMYPGVSARKLPYRGGSNPLNHAITYFDRVRLPATSLLGTLGENNARVSFQQASALRIAIGSVVLGSYCLPALEVASSLGYRYSLRRNITDSLGKTRNIFSFPTQHTPIATAVCRSIVLRSFRNWAIAFLHGEGDIRVKYAVGGCYKTTIIQQALSSLQDISNRCGAQGLFGYNLFSVIMSDIRGLAIAEGDTLVVSIRSATEILLNRYKFPDAIDSSSYLATHEQQLFEEGRDILKRLGIHRSNDFEKAILPRCQALIEAVGHRMAYDAAVLDGVSKPVLDLFVVQAMKFDPAWYSENAGISRKQLYEMETKAVEDLLPHLPHLVQDLNVELYSDVSPLSSEAAWDDFTRGLQLYTHAGNQAKL